jgi:two-component system nitrate/nitrite response regulator NarL
MGAVLIGANVLLREGLSRILTAAGFRIIASTPCADVHVLSTLPQEQPVLFIIDVSDDFDAGLRQIACFKQACPVGRVVVLGDQHRLPKMVSAFRAGANAYLVKVTTSETFVKSLELVVLGVTLLPPEILNLISDRQARNRNDWSTDDDADAADDNDDGQDGKIVGPDVETNKRALEADGGHAPRLSARQQAILRCLAEGNSNKTIARKMVMAEATVKVQVRAILRKIRVHNRTQAAIWAMSSGPPSPAKGDFLPVSEKLPIEQFPNLDSSDVRSTSLTATKLKDASRVTMRSALRLVRKSD